MPFNFFSIFSSGGGGEWGRWRRYRHFLAGIWSLLDLGMKKVNLFLCDLMSNPLQNHECNILPRMVSNRKKNSMRSREVT